MSRAVLDSSVIIALSNLGYLSFLEPVFSEVLIPCAVFEEICGKGKGLVGERQLSEAVDGGLIRVKDVHNRVMVDALLDPLALGEAEAIVLTVEEKADCIVLDDKLARRRAELMGLNVIGTLRGIRLMYDAELLDKKEALTALKKLRETGFRISNQVLKKAMKQL